MLTSYEYSEIWICLNCRNIGALSEHGRCTTCDSDSVAVADTGRPLVCNEIQELERLFQEPIATSVSDREVYRPLAAKPLFCSRADKRVPGHRRASRYR